MVQKKGVHGWEITETGSGLKKRVVLGRAGVKKRGSRDSRG